MGDRVVVLDKGIIQQAASPEEIYNDPANTFVAGFVGSPQMNFIDAKTLGSKKDKLSSDNLIAGIRPEKMVCGGKIKLTVDVDMAELLGSEKIVYFYIEGQKCSAKLPADYNLGATLELSINEADIYLFDAVSGERVR
jgi:multiple sugar transport system ATP-binding protein